MAARGVLENAVQKDEYPNFVLAVSHEGAAISLSAAPKGLNERSIFPLASITKPFIATALMRLVERGRLILNEPVSRAAQVCRRGPRARHAVAPADAHGRPGGRS